MGKRATVFKPKVLSGYSRRGPRRRKKPPHWRPPPHSIDKILAWADEYHERRGKWPNLKSGWVRLEPSTTWQAVDMALKMGYRGLPGGSSLAKLLAEHRGVRNQGELPRLTIHQILAWADAHQSRTGRWPNSASGPVFDAPGEDWGNINTALRKGGRGFKGGISLGNLLAEERNAPKGLRRAPLTEEQILAWADAFHERTGTWPRAHPAPIVGGRGETWCGIDLALKRGGRGLAGGSSLRQLLAEKRGLPKRRRVGRLTTKQILTWAKAHYRRTGKWPNKRSGAIHGAPGDTWNAVDSALRYGYRSLPSGLSLRRVLAQHGCVDQDGQVRKT